MATLVPMRRASSKVERRPRALGREGVPERVRVPFVESGRLERWVPLASPPGVEPDVPALRGGEDERRVDARRQRLDGGECRRGERHAQPLRLRVRRFSLNRRSRCTGWWLDRAPEAPFPSAQASSPSRLV
jgi:hypothetical protein